MIEYEKQIFLDILQEDGLVVVAKGLGIDSVILSLLKVYCDPGNLVFVLGAEGKHQEWLLKKLRTSGVTPQPKIVSSDIGGAEREQSYLEGGLWFVPPTILVVDIIRKRVPVDLITGMIVCKAHKILKNHQAAFVLRLYRQGNKTGFIKAFSDQAPAFKGSFTKVEQILKALFLRNLLLWPRYHAVVKSSLNQCKPTVIELHLEMTSKMVQLQNALLDLIKQTVQELKRLNPTLDTEDVTVENAISDAFHKILHSQLDPLWHALSERTKTLLADLKLFHHMIRSLITLDSVSFYALVNSQRKSERALKGSGWHLLPSAEILFTSARNRVFPPSTKTETFHVNDMDAEPHPKWLVLSEVLAEIHREFAKRKPRPEESDAVSGEDVEKKMGNLFGGTREEKSQVGNEPDSPADVLILTRDTRNCWQLQSYLTLGAAELLSMQYRKWFSGKHTWKPVSEGGAVAAGKDEVDNAEADEAEEKEEDGEEQDESKSECYTLSLSTFGLSQLEPEKKVNLAGHFEDSLTLSQKSAALAEDSMQTQSTATQADTPPPLIVIQTFGGNLFDLAQILQDRKPHWVIMYDVEMTVVRQLEVYQRNNPLIALKVYFLVFGGTIEEQAYLTSLRKEKEAFDHLIEEKSKVVIPEDINDFPSLCREDWKVTEPLRTRKGGMESPKKDRSKIIVDIREFRSELPALIHARGIEIEPLFLTIGDYILTPDICLERKNVVDLISSLNSGRLYDQASAMIRHYSRPMLLIEFDKNKPFDLQDRYYLSTDASPDYIVTKLQVLTLHFPQLRLIWSPSPQATAELLEELKLGHPEPDSATAAGVGSEEVVVDEDRFNVGVKKFLSELPGVTNKNVTALLRKGRSLDHLCAATKRELSELVENEAEGEMLYGAFHERYEASGEDEDEEEDEEEDVGTAASKRGHSSKGGFGRGKRKRFH